MIRPFTVLCLLAACGSGLYLYSEKHRTELLERDIGHVIHATEAARARTGLLRAEWALLNEPGRLQDMSGRYLALHPMAPTQFVQLAELASHLPAPVATPPEDATDDDEASPTAASTQAPPQGPTVANAAPPGAAPADAGPQSLTHHPMMPAHPDPHAAARMLASAGAHTRTQHHTALADRMMDPSPRDSMLARGTPLPLASPQPMGASVYSAMARPMRAVAPRPTIVAAVPSYAPARSYVPSSLGGGAALPPPTPYGQ